MLRSMKYGIYAAVLAGVVGGTVAWTTVDKNVKVVVDGQERTIHTTANDVSGAISSAGYKISAHDIVAPAATDSIHDGETVVFKRGRMLKLTVNGHPVDVWTTATTVQAALAQLGYSGQDAVSVSRSTRLPLSPTALSVHTVQDVTVVSKGKGKSVTTTAPTVAALLAQLKLPAASTWTSAPTQSSLESGMTLVVKAMKRATSVQNVSIPFATTSKGDASLPKGVTQISTPGRTGTATVTYALVYLDGKLYSKIATKKVTTAAPVTQVQSVGTADVGPVNTPAGAQAYAATQLSKFGWGQDQMSCLITMWDHESGWRVNAANPSGAYGIPQALPGSKMGPGWESNAIVQIQWGLTYIKTRYSTPCGAWAFWQQGSWY